MLIGREPRLLLVDPFNMLGSLYPRQVVPEADNGLVVDIVSWVLLVAMIFTLLTRFTLKLALSRKAYKFGWDDITILLAAVGTPESVEQRTVLNHPTAF